MKRANPLPRPLDLTSTVKLVSGDNVMVMARCFDIQNRRWVYDMMGADRTIAANTAESQVVALIKQPLDGIISLSDLERADKLRILGPDVIRGMLTVPA